MRQATSASVWRFAVHQSRCACQSSPNRALNRTTLYLGTFIVAVFVADRYCPNTAAARNFWMSALPRLATKLRTSPEVAFVRRPDNCQPTNRDIRAITSGRFSANKARYFGLNQRSTPSTTEGLFGNPF
jgi:hypothetical protein